MSSVSDLLAFVGRGQVRSALQSLQDPSFLYFCHSNDYMQVRLGDPKFGYQHKKKLGQSYRDKIPIG